MTITNQYKKLIQENMSKKYEKLIEEFNIIRTSEYSPERTNKCNVFVQKLLFILDKENPIFTATELDNMIQSSEGDKLLCIVYLKYSKNFIVDLERIFSYLLKNNVCLYLEFILRDNLSFMIKNNMLNIEDIYMLRFCLKNKTGLERNQENFKFLEFLSDLVMVKYSKIIRTISFKRNEEIFGTIDCIRVRASMCGMVLGDALGFLVEGQSRKICHEYVNDVIKAGIVGCFSLHKDFGHKQKLRYCKNTDPEHSYNFGQYTDDSQCARELIRSIIDNKGNFDGNAFSKRIVTLFSKAGLIKNVTQVHSDNTTGIVGYGYQTLNSAQNISNCIPWQLAASRSGQGNGGCMRVGPIGALFYNQPEKIAEIASNQCAVTHASSRCKATSVMIAECVRLACEHSIVNCLSYDISKYPDVFCNRLANTVMSYDIELAKLINKIPIWLKKPHNLLENVVKESANLGDKNWHNGKVISASAVQSSVYAICCFLSHPNSYMDAICMAIEGGGDTDTVAAMCGSISGAYTKHFENDLLYLLNDQNKWNCIELCNLCDKAFKMVNYSDILNL